MRRWLASPGLDSGTQVWSVEDEAQLVDLLGTGVLARAAVGHGRQGIGTACRQRHADSATPVFPHRQSQYSFAGQVLKLRPAGIPRPQLGAEFSKGLERAVAFSAASQGVLHIGPGGWDLSETPYCMFARPADGSPDWMIQTSPGAQDKSGLGTTSCRTTRSPESESARSLTPFPPTIASFMAKACATWGMAPWISPSPTPPLPVREALIARDTAPRSCPGMCRDGCA